MLTRDDCAKDGAEEFFLPRCTAVFSRIPIESLKICDSKAMHLGKKFLAAIFSTILYLLAITMKLFQMKNGIKLKQQCFKYQCFLFRPMQH